jgi:hypothetical protein
VTKVTELVPKHLRSVSEVAAYLRQCEQSVYRQTRSKKLRASKVGANGGFPKRRSKLLEDGMNVKK